MIEIESHPSVVQRSVSVSVSVHLGVGVDVTMSGQGKSCSGILIDLGRKKKRLAEHCEIQICH